MKNIVITGSTKGIGYGLAKEFLKKGCSVAISARGQATLDKVLKEFGDEFGSDKVHGQTCDVSDVSQIQSPGPLNPIGAICGTDGRNLSIQPFTAPDGNIVDRGYGPPRFCTETRSKNVSVNYIIKY